MPLFWRVSYLWARHGVKSIVLIPVVSILRHLCCTPIATPGCCGLRQEGNSSREGARYGGIRCSWMAQSP